MTTASTYHNDYDKSADEVLHETTGFRIDASQQACDGVGPRKPAEMGPLGLLSPTMKESDMDYVKGYISNGITQQPDASSTM